MNYKIFSVDGTDLAREIVKAISGNVVKQGELLGNFKIDTFSDGEFSPQFKESIRDLQVF